MDSLVAAKAEWHHPGSAGTALDTSLNVATERITLAHYADQIGANLVLCEAMLDAFDGGRLAESAKTPTVGLMGEMDRMMHLSREIGERLSSIAERIGRAL